MILESFGHLEFTSVCCSDKLSRRFEFLVFFSFGGKLLRLVALVNGERRNQCLVCVRR